MYLHTVIEILKDLNITYELYAIDRISPEVQFKPASLKNVISNGIYYIQSADSGFQVNMAGSIIITNKKLDTENHQIIVENPQLAHYKLTRFFVKEKPAEIHPTAIISKDAVIGEGVSIGPYSVIGDCVIGDRVRIKNNVVIEDNVTIKTDCFIDSNSVIGAGGLAWIWDENGTRIMQPQIGGVIIEENCLIATDVTIVRGSLSENTRIGACTVIAHGTKIGHGSQIGANVHMANNVSLAGNATIGDFTFLGSGCVISSNIKVPKHTIVGAAALVNKNFEEEYTTLAGVPAVIIKTKNFEHKPQGAPQPFKNK
ncbi:MAG: hypothetical protein ACI7YS_13700 [Flavobacterium sp.]